MSGHKKLTTRYALPSNSTRSAEQTEPVSDEIVEYPPLNKAHLSNRPQNALIFRLSKYIHIYIISWGLRQLLTVAVEDQDHKKPNKNNHASEFTTAKLKYTFSVVLYEIQMEPKLFKHFNIVYLWHINIITLKNIKSLYIITILKLLGQLKYFGLEQNNNQITKDLGNKLYTERAAKHGRRCRKYFQRHFAH